MEARNLLFTGLVFLLSLTTIPLIIYADIPPKINFQGYLTDSGGEPVDGDVSMVFSIYNAPTGGTLLWTETQNVKVSNGTYSLNLGDSNAIKLPFDTPYFLGVRVGDDPEMAPRRPLTSVGYAFRSKVADALGLTCDAGQVIRWDGSTWVCALAVNMLVGSGLGGAQTEKDEFLFIADAGVTTPRLADTSVTSPKIADGAVTSDKLVDGSVTSQKISDLAVTSLKIAPSSVLTPHLFDGSVTPVKVNPTGANPGQALIYDGTNVVWGDPSKVKLPFSDVASSSAPTFSITNTGEGSAGNFEIDNPSSFAIALSVKSNGREDTVFGHKTGSAGGAGTFTIGNPSNSSEALYASTNGTGSAGGFEINNPSSTNVALYGITNGSGDAVSGFNNGVSGKGGWFRISNSSNPDSALGALTYGIGIAGKFHIDNPFNTSPAVRGWTNGKGRAGEFQISNSQNSNNALTVNTDGSGTALYAFTNGTGGAGRFEIANPSSASHALSASTNGIGKAGYFGGPVEIFGDLNIGGHLSKHSGEFVQPHLKDPTKEVVYAFFEGPEHAVFLRGTTKLVNGRATIETPEHFRVVAGHEGITVHFTPRSSKSKGLAAVEVTREMIKVEELMEGSGSYEFDYFITARRAGFEAHQPIQSNTHFSADGMTKEDFEQRYARADLTTNAMRNLLIANGILNPDGSLNMATVEKLGWRLKESDMAKADKVSTNLDWR